jgi:hypothetical protein
MTTQVHPSEHSHGSGPTPEVPVMHGLLAEYSDVDSILNAARKVRAEGYKIWDVHSPFPIHGIDAIIGIRPTILPWIILVMGLSGCGGGLALQWYTNAFDYPFMISGKPFWSLPANIPVIFECTVLFSAVTAVFAMFGLNRLPMLYNPLFKSKRFARVTNDKFFIWIDASDKKFDEKATAEFLLSLKAEAVERIED